MGWYTLAIDTGGTFTDFLLLDKDGNYESYKTPSTPVDSSVGIMEGLAKVASTKSLSLRDFIRHIGLIVHGTTVATNAVLTGTGVKTGLVTTSGLRDILEMRRGIRGTFYNNKYIPPPTLVPRYLRLPITERLDRQGKVVVPLAEQDVRLAGELLQQEKVEAVAICFAHSYANMQHELLTREILLTMLPGVFFSLSSEVLPQPRLNERVSTTVLNAYVGPVLHRYLNSLISKLEILDFQGILLIMQSNGGVASPEVVMQTPASTLLSGPAAGPTAGIIFSQVHGFQNCITMDMGGTSFEAALVRNGLPLITRNTHINRNAVALQMMEIHTIGAGGGSIAWLDDGGFLHMGPQSAGAMPGPAAYGLGGKAPTCTDADLVLGYLNPNFFLGGSIQLYPDKARKAINNNLAHPLGITVEEAAWGMFQVITTNMATGIKEISVQKGYDPREFPLVVGGGAGPLHCAMLAAELEIPLLIIPRESSVMCAMGMLFADLKYDYVRSYHTLWEDLSFQQALSLLDDMIAQGEQDLSYCQNQLENISHLYFVDLRYAGQHNEITVPFKREYLEKNRGNVILETFHSEHNRQYGYSFEDTPTPVEILCFRLTCIGSRRQKIHLKKTSPRNSREKTIKGYRPVYLPDLGEFKPVPVWAGTDLGYPGQVEGPAIIELMSTTIFIPSDFDVSCDQWGNFLMYLKGSEQQANEILSKTGILV